MSFEQQSKGKSDPPDGRDAQSGGPTSDDAFARGASAGMAESPTEGAASGTGDGGPATDEQRERYLRLAAEYDNYRKRSIRERQEAGSRGQADLVRQFIDALDDLSRFAHVDPATTDTATVVQGVDMVERKIMKALTAAGLQVIDPVDQMFDPALHEAVATEPALSPEDDHLVARVYQPGYIFNGQLLRPARVVVRQYNR